VGNGFGQNEGIAAVHVGGTPAEMTRSALTSGTTHS
jgi:hypothetical protein